jgi:hypothetical protein
MNNKRKRKKNKKCKGSGFIVFLQIVFCFHSLKTDNTKTANDLASRGRITHLVLMPVFSLPSLYVLSLFPSLRKCMYRILLRTTRRAREHYLMARK